MTMDETIRSFTADAAYAAFEERHKGTLAPGMSADLTIVDRDVLALPRTELLSASVVATVVAGEVAYSRLPALS